MKEGGFEGEGVDPNYFFGGYAVTALAGTIAAFFLSPVNEPEVIRLKDVERASAHGVKDSGLGSNCNITFSEIGRLFGHNEFLLPILYFLIQGVLMPNFDEVHYIFLTEDAGMPKYKYDYLNCIAYVSMVLFNYLYGTFWSKTQVWLMIEISLALFLAMTVLMLIVVLRVNIHWGVSDDVMTALMFVFGTQTLWTIATIPIQV